MRGRATLGPVYEIPRSRPKRKQGNEPFTKRFGETSVYTEGLWCWSTSDFLNNTTRGVLAKFLVAKAHSTSK